MKGDLCEWRILATHGEKIVLNITSLDIPASVSCQLDYLEVCTLLKLVEEIRTARRLSSILPARERSTAIKFSIWGRGALPESLVIWRQ